MAVRRILEALVVSPVRAMAERMVELAVLVVVVRVVVVVVVLGDTQVLAGKVVQRVRVVPRLQAAEAVEAQAGETPAFWLALVEAV
jgi:hypothetical protein